MISLWVNYDHIKLNRVNHQLMFYPNLFWEEIHRLGVKTKKNPKIHI